jgi:hypothetical protein
MGNSSSTPIDRTIMTSDITFQSILDEDETMITFSSSDVSSPQNTNPDYELIHKYFIKHFYNPLETTIKNYLLYNNSHNKNNIILADLEKKIKIQENDLKSKNEDNEKIKTSLEFIKDDLIQKEKEKIILIIALVFLIIGIIILSIILLKLNNIDVILYINNYLSKIVLIFKNYRSRLPL